METKTGTLYYMSPNVLNGEYDMATDVWSLGVILYIMLVGYPPFQGNDEEIIEGVMSGEFDMENDDWEFISPMCKDLISRMLVVESNERISIDEILSHPWVQSWGDCMQDTENDNSNEPKSATSVGSSKDYNEHENRNGGNSNDNQINQDSNSKLWEAMVGDDMDLSIDQMPPEQAAICALLIQQRLQQAFNFLDTDHTGKIDPLQMLPELSSRNIKMNTSLWNNF